MTDRNLAAADARRRRRAEPASLINELRSVYRDQGDKSDDHLLADIAEWWRTPTVLGQLGAGLAGLFPENPPSVVMGVQSRGTLVGALVAAHLGIGLVEVRKNDTPKADSDRWRMATTPPDYRDRHLRLGFPSRLLAAGERVLFVDDWIDTGGQAAGARALTEDAGAQWIGAAVIVDALDQSRVRRELTVRALLHIRDL